MANGSYHYHGRLSICEFWELRSSGRMTTHRGSRFNPSGTIDAIPKYRLQMVPGDRSHTYLAVIPIALAIQIACK